MVGVIAAGAVRRVRRLPHANAAFAARWLLLEKFSWCLIVCTYFFGRKSGPTAIKVRAFGCLCLPVLLPSHGFPCLPVFSAGRAASDDWASAAGGARGAEPAVGGAGSAPGAAAAAASRPTADGGGVDKLGDAFLGDVEAFKEWDDMGLPGALQGDRRFLSRRLLPGVFRAESVRCSYFPFLPLPFSPSDAAEDLQRGVRT